jgi:hypothetical protein
MRHFMHLAAWAAGSFVVTIALLRPATLDAVSPPPAPGPGVSSAKIVSNGVELSLLFEGNSSAAMPIVIKPNSQLTLQLVAKNTAGQSVDLHPMILIHTTRTTSFISRVLPMPTLAWQHDEPITLGANETQTINLSPPLHLLEGTSETIELRCGSTSIRPLMLVVKS